MKNFLSSGLLIAGLLAGNPAHATGVPVIDIAHIASTVAGWMEDAAHAGKEAAQWVKENLHDAFVESEWGKQYQGMKDAYDQTNDLYAKTRDFLTDPVGSVMETTALDEKRTLDRRTLPMSYSDGAVKNFRSGDANSDISSIANKSYAQIMEGASDEKITLFAPKKEGDYENAMKNRDAREAAYYLALTQTAYEQASKRYQDLQASYAEKIKTADETKDKERMMMELQAEQIMLQNQHIQLTALQQAHEARQEVMRVRKEQVAKNRKRMSVL